MSDETYYTVLNVKETASLSEIKTAYRELIKQVHPDTIANSAPYLRRIAEDKAKEINEAHGVLSNSTKRRDYDRQLAEYRRQNAPPAPPPPTTPPPTQQATSQASSGPYCNWCGTSLYASGFCPRCNNFTTPSATPPQRTVGRRFGYNWAPLLRWARQHPIFLMAILIFVVAVIAVTLSRNDTSSAARAAATNRGGYGGSGEGRDYGLGQGGQGKVVDQLEVLSDTMGVDFGPYLQRVLHDVRQNWYNLIPEVAHAPLMKKGKVSLEFAITKDGNVAGLKYVSSSGDVALDRAAYGGITASNPFPPLPSEFRGNYLELRFNFFYNPDASDLPSQADLNCQPPQRVEVNGRFICQPAPAQPSPAPAPAPGPPGVAATPTLSLSDAVNKASYRHNIDLDLLNSMIRVGSGFNPHAVSANGAQGLMQLMPQTASKLGVSNAFDPAANVDGGAGYLQELLERYNYDMMKALAAYHDGPEAVDLYGGVPPYYKTRVYVASVVRDFNSRKLAERNAAEQKAASASELAVLRSGFTIRHERREVLGTMTRLYTSDTGKSYVDIPTTQIDHFEKDLSPPPAPSAPLLLPSPWRQ